MQDLHFFGTGFAEFFNATAEWFKFGKSVQAYNVDNEEQYKTAHAKKGVSWTYSETPPNYSTDVPVTATPGGSTSGWPGPRPAGRSTDGPSAGSGSARGPAHGGAGPDPGPPPLTRPLRAAEDLGGALLGTNLRFARRLKRSRRRLEVPGTPIPGPSGAGASRTSTRPKVRNTARASTRAAAAIALTSIFG